MEIEVSIGEVADKLSILAIKMKKVEDEEKLINIEKEFKYLNYVIPEEILFDDLFAELCNINEKLWNIEADIRDCESEENFGERFVQLARLVYFTNDERARVKREINIKYASSFIEEKSYKKY